MSGKTKTEAISKGRQLIFDYANGTALDKSSTVAHQKNELCQFILTYLNVYKKQTVRSITLENYYYMYEHIERDLNNVFIEDLTPLTVQQFLNKLAATKKNGKYLGKRTIEGVYGILDQALNLAVKQKSYLLIPSKMA